MVPSPVVLARREPGVGTTKSTRTPRSATAEVQDCDGGSHLIMSLQGRT